jgi:hypothetical protein
MSSISINEAATYTSNWRTFNQSNQIGDYNISQLFPNAYNVNIEDIAALVNEPGIEKIRIYFGYDTKNPEPQPDGTFPMKVMIVGVDGSNKDIIYTGTELSGIYDHCQPCPSLCDTASPLSSTRKP